MTQPTQHRDRGDRCPGARRVHQAADGAIGRIRLPGGRARARVLGDLADLAERFGDGDVHLTARGNLQIRGIADPAGFAGAVAAAGLLPHPAHDRMRNILSSPLTGRLGGAADVGGLVDEVDAALCADPVLAELPGRTLIAIDDGRGDVLAEAPDLGLLALGGDEFELILAGTPTGHRAGRGAAAALLHDAARAWAALRGDAWQIAESGRAAEVAAAVTAHRERRAPTPAPAPPPAPVGWLTQDDGRVALAAGLRFGVLPGRIARALAHLDCPVRVTAGYSLVLLDLDEDIAEAAVRALAPAGLVFDAASDWLRVSACTGAPACRKAVADTRGDAAAGIAGNLLPAGRVHFSGCERRCGAPKTGFVDYLAVAEGEYEVTDRAGRRPPPVDSQA